MPTRIGNVVQIGVPSQHAAAPTWLQRHALAINYALRCKLSKVVPAIISPPAARLLSVPKRIVRHSFPERLYQEALNAANKTTAVLCGGLIVFAAALAESLRRCICSF